MKKKKKQRPSHRQHTQAPALSPSLSISDTAVQQPVHTVPFLRLSNVHIRAMYKGSASSAPSEEKTISSLSELGLYALMSAILSNPAFTYAAGGMQRRLLSHTKNGAYALHTAMRALQKRGFLRRTRTVVGTNSFRDYYTLFHKAEAHPVGTKNLSGRDSAAFADTYTPFIPPTDDFTMVSIPMLFDARISLAAKGLYAVIARHLRLASYDKSIFITKSLLKRLCPVGDNAFDRLFRELRASGYLQLTRTRSDAHARGFYHYVLYGEAGSPQSAVIKYAPQREKTETRKHPVPVYAASARGRDAAEIREQIEYDCLLSDYPRAQLDCIVSILGGFWKKYRQNADPPDEKTVLLSGKDLSLDDVISHFSALDSEDIRFVLDTLATVSQTQSIRNVRAYLTTCLYNAKEELQLSLSHTSLF